MSHRFKFREISTLLQKTTRVAVLTGAGISEESGIPTFRDAEKGLWADYDPEDFATLEGFLKNPKKVWDWYEARRKLMGQVRPNAAHEVLAELEKNYPEFRLITQNIDNLHQQAGSQKVIELHGNIHRIKCFEEGNVVEHWDDQGDHPPRCPRCGGMLRPDVVWFGEILPVAAIEEAFEIAKRAEVFFSIGTSAQVEPAASLPLQAAYTGAKIIEINREETSLTPYADIFLQGPAGEILADLLHSL